MVALVSPNPTIGSEKTWEARWRREEGSQEVWASRSGVDLLEEEEVLYGNRR
jgi:hypothetical protein